MSSSTPSIQSILESAYALLERMEDSNDGYDCNGDNHEFPHDLLHSFARSCANHIDRLSQTLKEAEETEKTSLSPLSTIVDQQMSSLRSVLFNTTTTTNNNNNNNNHNNNDNHHHNHHHHHNTEISPLFDLILFDILPKMIDLAANGSIESVEVK